MGMIVYDSSPGGCAVRKTIYLPDDLAARVDEYLSRHQNETLSSLVQRALEDRVGPKNPHAILDLIGFVSVDTAKVHRDFTDRPEDEHVDWYDGPPR
jgi:hypothetical protein